MKTTFSFLFFIYFSFLGSVSVFADTVATTNSSTKTVIYTSEKVPGSVCTCVANYSDNNGNSIPQNYIDGIQNNPSVTYNPDKGTYSFSTPDGETTITPNCGNPSTRKYKCTVSSGLSGFQNLFSSIVRTVVYIVMLLGVLAIVGLGIAWAWAGGDDVKMKSNLKHWAVNVLIGLIILFFFRYILTFLAPWIFR